MVRFADNNSAAFVHICSIESDFWIRKPGNFLKRVSLSKAKESDKPKKEAKKEVKEMKKKEEVKPVLTEDPKESAVPKESPKEPVPKPKNPKTTEVRRIHAVRC